MMLLVGVLVCLGLAILLALQYATKSVPLYGVHCFLPNKLQVWFASRFASIKVTQLLTYPIKGCKPISMRKALVTNRGLRFDREWIVIDSSNNSMVTQRQVPEMTRIHTHLDFARPQGKTDEECICSPEFEPRRLVLWKEGSAEEKFALDLDSAQAMKVVDIQVWGQAAAGVDEGDEVAWWLHRALKSQFDDPNAALPKYRLLRFKSDFSRQISEPRRIKATEETQFADGYPILVTSVESLSMLNKWINAETTEEKKNIPMNRFRPNIVIHGAQAGFVEDTLFRVEISKTSYRFVKPCDRCVVPTTDQDSGKRGKEPTRTMRVHRLSEDSVLFGQNVVPEVEPKVPSVITVGDRVVVKQVKPEFKLF